MNPTELKADLRRSLTVRLDSLSPSLRAEASRQLCARLDQSMAGVHGTILAFLPLPDEIDLEPFLQNRLDRGIAVPDVDWTAGTMQPARLTGLGPGDLKAGRHGLRRPTQVDTIPLNEIQLIVVPGLAFDSAGRRLGRGGGFYDRLLAELPGGIPTVGVCFDQQVVDRVPVDTWDCQVDQVLTPTQEFSPG